LIDATVNPLGVRTLASQPLYFATNSVERMRIDASGNLLVGKTTTDFGTQGIRLEGSNGKIELTRTNNVAFAINRLSTDGDLAQFAKDGTTVGSIGSIDGAVSNMVFDPRSGGVGLTGSGTTGIGGAVVPTSNVGAVNDGVVSVGDPAFRFKDLYLSGGVYLGGTTSANLLDDYEEGTWTPVDASGAGLTFTVVDARYTKVGRMVQCYAQVSYPSTADASQAGIGGLPFASASTANFSYGAFTVYTNYDFALWLNSNGSTLSIAHNLAGASVTNANVSGKQFRLVWIYDT
jgi:hypothetical protein